MADQYKPVSDTEYILFLFKYCSECIYQGWDKGQDQCSILQKLSMVDIDSQQYPSQWVYNKDGNPICEAFEAE